MMRYRAAGVGILITVGLAACSSGQSTSSQQTGQSPVKAAASNRDPEGVISSLDEGIPLPKVGSVPYVGGDLTDQLVTTIDRGARRSETDSWQWHPGRSAVQVPGSSSLTALHDDVSALLDLIPSRCFISRSGPMQVELTYDSATYVPTGEPAAVWIADFHTPRLQDQNWGSIQVWDVGIDMESRGVGIVASGGPYQAFCGTEASPPLVPASLVTSPLDLPGPETTASTSDAPPVAVPSETPPSATPPALGPPTGSLTPLSGQDPTTVDSGAHLVADQCKADYQSFFAAYETTVDGHLIYLYEQAGEVGATYTSAYAVIDPKSPVPTVDCNYALPSTEPTTSPPS